MPTPRPSIRTRRVFCAICGRDEGEVIAKGRDHEYRDTTTEIFNVVRCSCGLVYLNPRPDTSELGTIYPTSYYAYQLVKRSAARAGTRGASEKADEAASQKKGLVGCYMHAQAVRRLAKIARRVVAGEEGGEGPAILDVGCGDGTALSQWREAFGGKAKTYGVEMSEEAADVARSAGHIVTSSRIEDAALPKGFFRFAYSFHVIEHVDDPRGFLRAIGASLTPGGYLLIDTPNVDTWDFRLFQKGDWGGYHFPRHFTLYDAKTFGALAESSGFEVVSVEYTPNAVFWVWTFHSILDRRAPKLADFVFPPVDILVETTVKIAALLSVFTAVDLALKKLTGRTSVMRVLLRRRDL